MTVEVCNTTVPPADAEIIANLRRLWFECNGDLTCSTRCRHGYLGNAPGTDSGDMSLCRCGAWPLNCALDDLLLDTEELRKLPGIARRL